MDHHRIKITKEVKSEISGRNLPLSMCENRECGGGGGGGGGGGAWVTQSAGRPPTRFTCWFKYRFLFF